jgi:hypothetical protein
MGNRVIPTPYFESRLKKFLKKFPSLGSELIELEETLLLHPDTGAISVQASLNQDCQQK